MRWTFFISICWAWWNKDILWKKHEYSQCCSVTMKIKRLNTPPINRVEKRDWETYWMQIFNHKNIIWFLISIHPHSENENMFKQMKRPIDFPSDFHWGGNKGKKGSSKISMTSSFEILIWFIFGAGIQQKSIAAVVCVIGCH